MVIHYYNNRFFAYSSVVSEALDGFIQNLFGNDKTCNKN